MTKKPPAARGGHREGAGRKPQGPQGEKKKFYGVRLYPSHKDAIEAKYGSVQRALDSLKVDTEKK